MTGSRIPVDDKLFEKLLDAAPDPIVIVDEGGRIVMANAEAERKFGYARAELIDQPIELIVPRRLRQAHVGMRDDYQRAPRTRPMGVGLSLAAARKDGSEFPVEVSLSPLQTASGRLVIGIVRDISERQTAARALEAKAAELARSNAELEQFAYVASHDLQEPLRAIASACQLLERRYKGQFDADAQELFGFAVDGAKRLQELIRDLLDFSRVTTKAKPLARTDVEAVLRQVLSNLRAQIEATGASVTLGPMPVVDADATQLVQLFQNLISNGIKFNHSEPPTVHVSAREEPGVWRFSVKDNGIGIEPRYFDRLFEVFRRLHGRDAYPGTGIGLAICKKIVERHGGRIWVESAPGQGATFHFTLLRRSEA